MLILTHALDFYNESDKKNGQRVLFLFSENDVQVAGMVRQIAGRCAGAEEEENKD